MRRLGRWRQTAAMRAAVTACCAGAAVLWWSATASAQLDPLLFLRRVPPTVILVVDTSLEMLEDGTGTFYDPGFWPTSDFSVMSAFPSINSATTKTYRRKFHDFSYALRPAGYPATTSGWDPSDPLTSNSPHNEYYVYSASTVEAVPAVWDPSNPLTSNAPADKAFLAPTRWGIARAGITQAVGENANVTSRWGLIRLRQKNPRWRISYSGTSPAPGCDRPVQVSDPFQAFFGDFFPCNSTGIGWYGIWTPQVDEPNYAQATAPAGTFMVTPGYNSAVNVLNIAAYGVGDNPGFTPAGLGDGFADRPIDYALQDAKQMALDAMGSDSASMLSCRNTVVVLITGGKDSGDAAYMSAHDPTVTASSFLSVSKNGVTKRVPIHVIGIKVPDSEEAELQSIATNSGGVYHNVSSASELTQWINYAVQAGYARAEDTDLGNPSEFTAVSPIVGTVNLVGASDATGAPLPYTSVHVGDDPTAAVVPQRSNVLISAGFELPGFYGRLRAFRLYVPEPDSTASSGWKFKNDGTKLWPDLDGRPELAGQARAPLDPDTRNIYTYIPDGSGGGSMVAFTTANAATLAPHLNLSESAATSLITFVRSQPLGAIIGSTPALMDPPSLDPPPDDDYGRADATGTFAGDHTDRRSIIFVGANDGMMHAIDARTGYEVWAFIPYNLLPKLVTLQDGQPMDTYEYFVDSSPKLAEVKLDPSNSDPAKRWRSLLLFGEGPGGTFYQCFDVTEAGMGVDPTLDGSAAVSAMLAKFDSPDESISFMWAFPNYSSFDPTLKYTFTLFDGSPGNKITLWGDLKSTASYAEKTVGFTWSDPAVGPLTADRTVNAAIVGSGYFPDIEASIPNRGAAAPKAGNALYLIDLTTGNLIGNATGSTCAGTGCVSVGDVAANGRKNALQADPTAAGEYQVASITKAYVGDIDGKYWRFDFTSAGGITPNLMVDTGAPIYASSALLYVISTTETYMFFGTGSDLLAPTTPGGTGTFRLYGLKDNDPGSGATTSFAIDLATVSDVNGLANGERASTAPTVAGDIVFFTTTTEAAGTPCADFTAKLYGITYKGGAAYDTDNDGTVETSERVAATMAGRATAPFVVDQHLYFGTAGKTGGVDIQAFGDPEDFNNGVGQVGVRILSWREIR